MCQEHRIDPFPELGARILALNALASPNTYFGWDIATATDMSAITRFMADGAGKLWYIPDYLPDAWLDRISLLVDDEGKPHWLWTGWNNGKGHAKFSLKGKATYCYRWIVQQVTGIPLERFDYVDHTCKRKACLTYGCFEVVTPKMNTDRGPGKAQQFKTKDAYHAG